MRRMLLGWMLVLSLFCVACGLPDENADIRLRYSKDDVKSFVQLLNQDKSLSKGASPFTEVNCFNITPAPIERKLKCQVFKFLDTFESYLLLDGKIYPIGMGFGGMGLLDMEMCDATGDNQPDLVYTSSWGSGLHRSIIGFFDLKTQKDEQLDFMYMSKDILLKRLDTTSYGLYLAISDPKVAEKPKSGAYPYVLGTRIGRVNNENGTLSVQLDGDVKNP